MVNHIAAVAGLLACLAIPSVQCAKPVYAHFMLGIVENYSVEDWKIDISQAKEIGIDGFALNCAPPRVDSYTPKQLANAYAAAEDLDFKMFISFDFAYWSTGDTELITDILANYSSHPAQAYYNDGAVVSTFVGDNMNWNAVKSALPGQKITAIPMIQDPNWIPVATTGLDGAFSWYAWATDGGNSVIPGPMTTIWDDRFLNNLGDKPYMAPVSPWFSTHFNTKNWVFVCEEQPAYRWEQMLVMQPELVEIISWNDFGESHYISGSQPHHSDDGSSAWAAGFPHDAWRSLMKPYISAYKAGASAPTVEADELVYWYRPHPKDIACSADPLGAPRGKELLADVIFVTTMLTDAGNLTVSSGGQRPQTVLADAGIHTYNFTMGIGQQRFSVSRGGTEVLGGISEKEVSNTCETFNFNVLKEGEEQENLERYFSACETLKPSA
ncbi:Fc.00g043410.m01.CDS01 [Cosmosporella sp. VM-42]